MGENSEIAKIAQKNIKKMHAKKEQLEEQLITLDRRMAHLWLIVEEDDESEQKQMLKHYKKVEGKKSNEQKQQ